MGNITQKRGQHIVSNRWQYEKRNKGKRREKTELRNQVLSLFICLLLFAVVFVGRGIFPERMIHVGDQIHTLLTSNTDFAAVFRQLSDSISRKESIFQQADRLYQDVFGSDSVHDDIESLPQLTSLWSEERGFLNSSPALTARTSHYTKNPYIQILEYGETNKEEMPVKQEETEAAVPTAGTVLLHVDYSGQPLPKGYTMDQLSLGALETVTPLVGNINSVYGYRDHPINGRYQFHGGVDIGGQKGDTIAAFAAGTVEYVGKDTSYGLYLQLDHGNGIKSFYAHCDSICVQKGQSVALGEKIGEVGSSGSATGPHLHLELKYENMHFDPSYYIQCLSSQ